MSYELCLGDGCPLTDRCMRFRASINYKRDNHFSRTPFDHKKNKCAFFIDVLGDDEDVVKVNDIINGKKSMPD